MDYGDSFTFDYWVNADLSKYNADASFICTAEGGGSYTIVSVENKATDGWQHAEFKASTSGLYSFYWCYTRPNKQYSPAPDDFARVRSCKLTPGGFVRGYD